MQVYIDELQDQVNIEKRQSAELAKIKKECYEKVKTVQETSKICMEDESKEKIKEGLTKVLSEISDFDQFSSD